MNEQLDDVTIDDLAKLNSRLRHALTAVSAIEMNSRMPVITGNDTSKLHAARKALAEIRDVLRRMVPA